MINYFTILKYGLPVIVVGLLVWFIYGMGESSANAKWQAKWDKYQDEIIAENAKKADESREKDNQAQSKIDEVSQHANNELNKARNDSVIANNAANSLRDEIKRYQAKLRAAQQGSSASTTGETAGADGDLLAKLSARLDEAAGELARVADENRIAGLACEASYLAVEARFSGKEYKEHGDRLIEVSTDLPIMLPSD